MVVTTGIHAGLDHPLETLDTVWTDQKSVLLFHPMHSSTLYTAGAANTRKGQHGPAKDHLYLTMPAWQGHRVATSQHPAKRVTVVQLPNGLDMHDDT
jgi:hypothetical protein